MEVDVARKSPPALFLSQSSQEHPMTMPGEPTIPQDHHSGGASPGATGADVGASASSASGSSPEGSGASVSSEPSAPPATGPTGVSALFAVFVSPGAVFEQLKYRPVFWLALIVGAMLTALGAALIPAEMGMAALREAGAELPGGEGMIGVMKWAGVGMSIPGYAIGVLLFAGLVTLLFGFILGDDATFRQYLSVVSYASLIGAAGYLLVTPLRIMQGDPELAFSIGTFLPFIQEGYLARFLNGLGLFSIWSWVVMGLGVSIVSPDRSWKSAASTIVITGVAFVALVSLIPR